MSARRPDISSRLTFMLTALPLFALYWWTHARVVTGEDAGELITAAHTFDVSHPPGYPIWVLLVGGLQRIFQGATPANVAALSSAIFSASALGIFAIVLQRSVGSLWAAVVAAWIVGVGTETWNHATIAEVYALNHLLLAALLYCAQRWASEPTASRLFWLALALGASCASHPLFLLLGTAVVGFVLVLKPRVLLAPKLLGLCVLGFALPYLSFLQVWYAAATDPWLSWGCEPTLAGLWDHYRREIYTEGLDKTPLSLSKLWSQELSLFSHLVTEHSLPILIAALGGLVCLWRRDRALGGLVVAMVLLGTVALPPLLNFDLDREDVYVNRVFLLPAALLLGFGIAEAIAAADRGLRLQGMPRRVACGLLMVLPLSLTGLRFEERDRSQDYWAEDYARAIFASVAKDGVLLPGGDNATFPLLYLQRCEGFRRDVLILDRCGALERDEALALVPMDVRPKLQGLSRSALEQALCVHSKRPLFFGAKPGSMEHLGLKAVPCGMLWTMIPAQRPDLADALRLANREALKQASFRNEAQALPKDEVAQLILGHVLQVRARDAFTEGRPHEAESLLGQAVALSHGLKEAINNIASLYAEVGAFEKAYPLFEEAIRIRQDYAIAHRNLTACRLAAGDPRGALAAGLRGMGAAPEDLSLFRLACEAAQAQKDHGSLELLCAARSRALPQDPEPFVILARWFRDELADLAKAAINFREAQKRAPDDLAIAKELEAVEAELIDKPLKTPETPGDLTAKAAGLSDHLRRPGDLSQGFRRDDGARRGGRLRRDDGTGWLGLLPGAQDPLAHGVAHEGLRPQIPDSSLQTSDPSLKIEGKIP